MILMPTSQSRGILYLTPPDGDEQTQNDHDDEPIVAFDDQSSTGEPAVPADD